MKNIAGYSRKSEVESWALDALDGPGLESDHQDLIGHDKSTEAQSNGEGEHGIHLVKLHGFNHITGLESVSKDRDPEQGCSTYTQHENKTAGDQTERSNDLRRGTSREVRGRWFEVQQDVCHTPGHRKPNQHVTPLFVHHSRCHTILVV